MLNKLSIFKRLLLVFTTIMAVSMVFIVTSAYFNAKKMLFDHTINFFTAENKQKVENIEKFFESNKDELNLLAEMPEFKRLIKNLEQYKIAGNPIDANNPDYKELTNEFDIYFGNYLKTKLFYDIIIIDKAGDIVYSKAKEDDFGTNLSNGKYKNTHLADLWKRIIKSEKYSIADYQRYAPSNNEFALFAGVPVYDNQKMLGVVIIQISDKIIYRKINKSYSPYHSAETYIVGKDPDGKFRLKINRIVKHQKLGDVKFDEAIDRCFRTNISGYLQKIGSTGKREFDFYSPLDIEGLNWALFTTVSVDEVMAPIFDNRNRMIYITIISVLLVAIASVFLARDTTMPIQKLLNLIEKIAHKNLNVDAKTNRKDELGKIFESLQLLIENFNEIIIRIKNYSFIIETSTNTLSTTAEELSSGSNEQSALSEQVSASMEEMLASISANSENAMKVQKVMKNTANSVKISNKTFLNTNEKITQIVEKSAIIKEIAEKTDIIAINAAIEAAKAGEAGKGFTVVAKEIRRLAEESNNAAAGINELSQEVINWTSKVERILKLQVQEVEKTVSMVDEITNASLEQTSNASQVNDSMGQLQEIIQKNSAVAEELSTSAEQLRAQTENLLVLLQNFKTKEKDKHVNLDTDEKNITTNEKHHETKVLKKKSDTKDNDTPDDKQPPKEDNKGFNLNLDQNEDSDDDFVRF